MCSGSSSVLPPALKAALGARLHATEKLESESPESPKAGGASGAQQNEQDWMPFQGAEKGPPAAAPFKDMVSEEHTHVGERPGVQRP